MYCTYTYVDKAIYSVDSPYSIYFRMFVYREKQLLMVPVGPCNYMVCIWALNGLPYPSFEFYVCTIIIIGPFGGYGRRSINYENSAWPYLADEIATSNF